LMSSNNGLYVIHQDALNNYLYNRIDYLVPYFVGVQSGVYNTEFNGGFFNNHINNNGNIIYFPSAQGIVFYLSVPIQEKKTKLTLNAVFADGKVVESPRKIARTTKKIRFEFFDITYNEFDNVYYQYKLEQVGEPVEWSQPSRSTFVQFDFLPPGNYVFNVRTINGSNTTNPEIVSYAFTIAPYFYERVAFQLGVGFLFLVSTVLLFQSRFRRKQVRIKRELEISNTIKELELNAIHAQMNPHMLFNSLNVLVYLIRSKSLEKAENFTVDFARFLRNILERSGDQFVEIRKEMEMLTNYLEIQKIRFNDSFTYSIDCDAGIQNVRIPSMLIQPFVENALVHGLAQISQGGILTLRCWQEEGVIHITIDDNGIGRTRSAELQEGKKWSSMGLKLIEKKIELLKAKHNLDIDLTIEDQESVNKTGTRVHIAMIIPSELSAVN